MSTKIGGVNKGSAYITTDNLNCMCVALTAGTVVLSTTPATLYAVIVSSHTSGTIKVWDGIAGNTTVALDTFSFPTGSGSYDLFGITTGTACTVVVGGTASVTLAYRKVKEYDLSNNVA